MFNPFEALPTTYEFKGVTYDVDMSYDNILLLYKMLNDRRLEDYMQILTGLQMLFGEVPKLEADELVELWTSAFTVLLADESAESVMYDLKGNPMPKAEKEETGRAFDMYQDAEYIYASFMQDYGMDLVEQQGKLHWYKFRALLSGLSENTKLRKVIEIRQMELPKGKGSEKQRQQILALKKAYALKDVDE